MINKFSGFIPFIIWVILIYILLTLPPKDFKEVEFEIPFADKAVHAALFAIMVLLFAWPYRLAPFHKNAFKIFLVMLVAIAYGIAMEYVQKNLTNPRAFEVGDMIADAVGAIAGFFIARKFIMYFTHKRKAEA